MCIRDSGKAPKDKYLPAFPTDVQFVIATVPNPITTHLPLVFDRMIEVIEQAAEDDKYSYDSSWFPWDEAKDYSSLSDQMLADKAQKLQESQPGVEMCIRDRTCSSQQPRAEMCR